MHVQVTTGSRLHFGFLNLSLAHNRLYGGIGVALDTPQITVTAEPADHLDIQTPTIEPYANHALTALDIPGATIELTDTPPRHTGLGSGTQLALAIYTALAHAYDKPATPRRTAPTLDRGGRSGVGVAVFETGGFVIDAGHPVERFTTDRPDRGTWTVPDVLSHHTIPDNWRFLLITPDLDPGLSGPPEETTLRAVIETADPTITSKISTCVIHQLLPAIATNNIDQFGRAVTELGRCNGQWYATVQGGVYRPPIGELIGALTPHNTITGIGQSSWGPTIYAVTDTDHAPDAKTAALNALETTGITGTVTITKPRNTGAKVTVS